MASWDEVSGRLLALGKRDRARAWDLVDAEHPRPEGVDFDSWLLSHLDAAVAAVELDRSVPGPKVRESVGRWPKACPGTGHPPARVTRAPHTYMLKNGKPHTRAGHGACPACGRLSAFSASTGIRRHVQDPGLAQSGS